MLDVVYPRWGAGYFDRNDLVDGIPANTECAYREGKEVLMLYFFALQSVTIIHTTNHHHHIARSIATVTQVGAGVVICAMY